MISISQQKAVNSSKSHSTHSFKTSEDSNYLCSTCKSFNDDLKVQIAQLKQKAHQSFMQVLQVQQLHEEELNQLKEQWNQTEQKLQDTIATLTEEIRVLKAEMNQVQKNVQKHSYDFGVKQLIIDNIEAIGCEDEERSYLDQSALFQFKELLTVKGGGDYVASLKRQIYKDFKFVSNNKTQIEKLFMVIRDLKDENSQLHKINDSNKLKLIKLENDLKESKCANDNMQRQNIFISQNLKRLGNDKLKLEKKVSELERKQSQETKSQYSPTFPRRRSIQKEDSSEKSQKYLQTLQQASEFSITRRQVNELNYAKFMITDEIESSPAQIKYQSKKKSNNT